MTQNVTLERQGMDRFTSVKLDPLGEAMVSIFACTGILPGSAVYVSTPLTSGEMVIDWHERRAGGEVSPQPSKNDVFRDNSARAEKLIAKVRTRFHGPTIEPTSLLDVPDWDQNQYHRFWCSAIERYARAVIFNEGWNYSTGCVAEFAAAVLTGADLYTHEIEPLSYDAGLDLVKVARDRIARVSLPTTMFDDVLAVLQHLDS